LHRRLLLASLQAAVQDMVLLVGRADPVCDGEAEERRRIREAPRTWLLGLLFADRRQLVHLIMAAALLNLCALAVPLYMRAVYDRVVPNLAIETMWALSVGIALLLAFEYAFRSVRADFVDAIGMRLGQLVQHRVMWGLLRARPDGPRHSTGALMTALRDVEAMAVLVPMAVVTFLVDVPFFLVFALMIYVVGGAVVVAPLLGAAVLALAGVAAAAGLRRAGGRATKLSQARHELVADVGDGLGTIKANGAQGALLRRWDGVADHVALAARAARRWNDAPGNLGALLVQLVTVLIVVIGVFQIKAGAMSVGGLVAATMLAGRAMVPISSAITLAARGYQSIAQLTGLTSLLAIEPEEEAGDPALAARAIRGDMALHGLSYRYPEAPMPVLDAISLRIRPGERIALIGKSGSGKSTLLRLLAGLASPSEGRLLIDGHDVSRYAAARLRARIGYCAQDAILFDASLRDNIVLGLDRVDEPMFERAAAASGVAAIADRLPDGYGTRLGSRGGRLSGGQRQAVLLARALARDPALLLLDEPTEAMDLATEAAIIAGLRPLLDGRTLLLATHRPALLTLAERVIWIEDGRIVADQPAEAVIDRLGGKARAA
jgi:ATP-binding cassette subfamily C protein LapB